MEQLFRRPIRPKRCYSTIPRKPRKPRYFGKLGDQPKQYENVVFSWESKKALIIAYFIAIILVLLILSPIL